MAATLEKPNVTIGIIPLTDCALIAIAREQGLFAKYGLNVAISREPSWASLRDKLMIGALDGAHMLAPMLFAATLGLGTAPFPMVTGLSLGLNGNAVTISNGLHEELKDADPAALAQRPVSAQALRAVIAARKRNGKPLLTFAMVFPFSLHNYLLRYWLATAGIHPDRDLRLIVVPPPQMGAALATGAIDGFCSGGPWNQAAVLDGLGHIALTGYEIWNNAPEKVFGVSAAWARENPETHLALLRAMIEAAQWLEKNANFEEAARILAMPEYVGIDARIIAASLVGRYHYHRGEDAVVVPDFHVFHRNAANFPWMSHGIWILSQMCRWGQLAMPVDFARVAEAVYRPDLYRTAVRPFAIPLPTLNVKPEGTHSGPWRLSDLPLGADQFIDGRTFKPAEPVAYLDGFELHAMRNVEPLRLRSAARSS